MTWFARLTLGVLSLLVLARAASAQTPQYQIYFVEDDGTVTPAEVYQPQGAPARAQGYSQGSAYQGGYVADSSSTQGYGCCAPRPPCAPHPPQPPHGCPPPSWGEVTLNDSFFWGGGGVGPEYIAGGGGGGGYAYAGASSYAYASASASARVSVRGGGGYRPPHKPPHKPRGGKKGCGGCH